MSEPVLGSIIEEGVTANRDAIHIAVVPLTAGEYLHRGVEFKLSKVDPTVALNGEYDDYTVGIVDPFLKATHINKGERFWGYLRPNTVTGMRHHWEHPDFDNHVEITEDHEKWLRLFCEEWNFNFDELIDAGTSEGGYRYVVAHGEDLHGASELGEDLALFWEHLEAYTGKRFTEGHKDEMEWSCSC